ncbi:MAG: hypothetical protein FLDDKLPJ_02136 [Phycisphaerae bacterium]|nr:hypothetical protein [Phycisphaerae bacterium]
MVSTVIATMLACTLLQDGVPTLASPTLKIGDPAPEMTIESWVKGEAVSIEAGRGQHCYILWFWRPLDSTSLQLASRMTILQERYASKGLRIIGVVTEDEKTSVDNVRAFVDECGPRLGWTVALDKDQQTWGAYQAASLRPREGIGTPRAYLIDREGKLLWKGVPTDPNFSDAVIDLVQNRLDPAVWVKIEDMEPMIAGKAQVRQWKEVLSDLDALLRLYPHSSKAVSFKAYVSAQQLKDYAGLNAWAKEFFAAYGKDPRVMLNLATAITNPATMGGFADREPETAYRAAKLAYDASIGTELLGDTAPIYAKSLFQLGAVRQGRKVLADACEKIKGFEADAMRADLAFYDRCIKLLDEIEKETAGAAQPSPAPPASAPSSGGGA